MTQEAANKRLAISFVVLIVVSMAVYFIGNRKSGSDIDRTLFQLKQSEEIDQVILSRKGQTTKLHFDGNRWKVNDSLDADRQMITVLFATLDQVEAKRAVSEKLSDSIAAALTTYGVRATFFSQQNKIAEYLIGGNAGKSNTYFLKEGDVTPYLVTIPGYRVYVSAIFEQEGNQWRDKRAFNFNWRNFKSLAAMFPKEPNQNFTITMKERYFGIDGINEIDTTRLNDYLDALSLLEAESFYRAGSGSPVFDSLLQVPPSFVLEVTDIANRNFRMEIFPPVRTNERVIGRVGREEMLFLKRDIVPIAKKRDFFRVQN